MAARDWILRAAGHSTGREIQLARDHDAAQTREVHRLVHGDEDRFRQAMEVRARVPCVRLGTTDTGVAYLIPVDELASIWVSASTGGGKSYLLAYIISQLLLAIARGARLSVTELDMKTELALLTMRVVAQVAVSLPPPQRARFLARVTTIRAFGGAFVPPLQILARDPSVSIMAQAAAVAESFELAVAAEFGVRQSSAFTIVAALCIEFGQDLLDLLWLLHDHDRLRSLARRSSVPEIRLYAATRLAKESDQTLHGILARVSVLTRVDGLKAALSARTMVDLRAVLQPGGVGIIDCGSPPSGAESAKKTVASLLFSRLTWAGFDPARAVLGQSAIIADEVQEAAATNAGANDLARIQTTGRSQGLHLILANQSTAQLPSALQSLLNTNIRWRFLGRSSEADARASMEFLPSTGLVPQPRMPGAPFKPGLHFLSHAEEQRFRIEELGRLPRQRFLIADRLGGFAPRVVTVPNFVVPPWESFPAEVRLAIERGNSGLPRAELLAGAHARETRAMADLEARQSAAEPAPAPLPDIVAARRNRAGRRGPT